MEIVRTAGHLGQETPESKYYALSTLLRDLCIPNDADAVCAWPGIILDAAVKKAVGNWNMGQGRFLLVAGYHESDVAEANFSIENLPKVYGVTRPISLGGHVLTQVNAGHAGAQAVWTAKMINDYGIESLTLCIPSFHLLRGYLTTLEALRRLGIMIPIIPSTPLLSPFEVNVLNSAPGGVRDKTVLDVIHAEVGRMESYQKPKADGSPGDVATTEYFMEYLCWLYQQPILHNWVQQ